MKLLTAKGVIGLSGFATCGKDFLFKLLAERGNVKRLALADSLKNDINPFLKEKYGIDIWNCTPEEKELVRPLLVAYGKVHRNRSGGTFFTSQLTPVIKTLSTSSLVVVTDIRYNDPKFPNDELNWIKSMGKLVHITKYSLNGIGNRVYVSPPNEDEAENNLTLRQCADHKIEWEHANDSLNGARGHVDALVDYLNESLGQRN